MLGRLHILKAKIIIAAAAIALSLMLTGCGEDPELTLFKSNVEQFCINLSQLDTSINKIDAEANNASDKLLGYIDQLDSQFQLFAELDFPEEFDYLEALADEAGDYMKEAAVSYQTAYADGGYDEPMSKYAFENYRRAYKRVQVIIIYLHGDEPTEADLVLD